MGLPIVIGLVYLGGWPFAVVAGVISMFATAEFLHGSLIPSRPFREVTALAPYLLTPLIMVTGSYSAWQFALVGTGIGVALLLAGLSPTNALGPRKPLRAAGFATLYLGGLLCTMVLLRTEDDGREWVFLAVLATFAVDTGAYTVGRLIGRHKMAPRISPKKTWEGAVGGYVAGAAAVFALAALFDLDVDLLPLTALALLLPVFAEAGDLFESWLKRRMGIKDASSVIPGHGGFMDRLDSILFVMPLTWIAAVLSQA